MNYLALPIIELHMRPEDLGERKWRFPVAAPIKRHGRLKRALFLAIIRGLNRFVHLGGAFMFHTLILLRSEFLEPIRQLAISTILEDCKFVADTLLQLVLDGLWSVGKGTIPCAALGLIIAGVIDTK